MTAAVLGRHDGGVTVLGDTTPPPATRATRPGWRDPRLWVGVAIVAVSVVAGARVVGSADDSVAVWAVTETLVAGEEVPADALDVRRVRFADEGALDRYLPADEPLPAGARLLRGVGAGELLPRAALGEEAAAGVLSVPVAVDPTLVPPAVGPGSVVDVYVDSDGRCDGCERPALSGVTVVDARAPDDFTGTRQLVLSVDEADAAQWFALLARAESPVITVASRG